MAYTDAWFVGDAELDETTARFCGSARSIPTLLASGDIIAATAWSWAGVAQLLSAEVIVDARHNLPGTTPNLPTRVSANTLTIAISPRYVAGTHAHIVLTPEDVGASARKTQDPMQRDAFRRIVVAPCHARFSTDRRIGDYVMSGETVGAIGRMLLYAPATGVLSGLSARGIGTLPGMPVIEVDTRGQAAACFAIPGWCRNLAAQVIQCALKHREPHAGLSRHRLVMDDS